MPWLAGAARLASASCLNTREVWARLLGLLLATARQRGVTAPCRDIKFNKVSANLRKINVMSIENNRKFTILQDYMSDDKQIVAENG